MSRSVQSHYGTVTVDWKTDDDGRLPVEGIPPPGVRVFYRREENKLTDMKRIVVVAYVHDKVKNQVHFQHCIWNEDLKLNSLPFSKLTHRYTALVRLMNKPMVMDLPWDQYCTGDRDELKKYTKEDGSFDWDLYKAREQKGDGLFKWNLFEDIIRAELMLTKQKKNVH